MAYRPLKRVLGESSLERKCLLFFGSCLTLAICGAFFYVEGITEQLVWEEVQIRGQGAADLVVMRHHFNTLIADREPTGGEEDSESYLGNTLSPYERELIRVINEDVPSKDYQWEVLALDLPRNPDDTVRSLDKVRAVNADEVITHLADLQRSQLLDESIDANAAASDPVFQMVWIGEDLYYYQPVYWKRRCLFCHTDIDASSGQPKIKKVTDMPLRVMKVQIPKEEVYAAFNKSRAFLIAAAIVTVFLSIVALYLVLNKVVLKPLNYLRDVSDEISRGNNQLRAEINTNDEFEDLAASFNRMLRHLGDAEQALREANTDLDGKVDQLAQANMQLHEMNRLKSEFLANMSHELRTPLNSILGFSDVLQSIDSLDEKQKRYVLRIRESGGSLLDMINDILDLAKVESGKMEVKLSEFHVSKVVDAHCDILRPLSDEKNIDLSVDIEDNLPPMFQDQSKLQQILMNLLSNAIKFTPEGGRITVRATQDEEGFLLLGVEDTGIGIPEEDRAVIFEKFRQASKTFDNLTREYSGTGLGLSIVKELCKLLGGTISFESELGKGSLFTARIPWNRPETTQRDSSLALRLEEATKSHRLAFQRLNRTANEAPQ